MPVEAALTGSASGMHATTSASPTGGAASKTTTNSTSGTRTSTPTTPPSSPPGPDDLSAERVADALNQAGGSITRAADLLGVTRHVLRRRIQSHGLAKKYDTTG